MARIGKSEEFLFLKKFDRFFPILYKEGKIKEPTRDAFMQYIGLSRDSWKNFRKTGIRRIYCAILELLEKTYPKE